MTVDLLDHLISGTFVQGLVGHGDYRFNWCVLDAGVGGTFARTVQADEGLEEVLVCQFLRLWTLDPDRDRFRERGLDLRLVILLDPLEDRVISPFSKAALASGMIGPLVVSQCAHTVPANRMQQPANMAIVTRILVTNILLFIVYFPFLLAQDLIIVSIILNGSTAFSA